MTGDRLLSARVRRYRALLDVRFTPATDRTVLVGGNGTGKSSLLDALALVGDLFRAGPRALEGWRRGNLDGATLDFAALASFGTGPVEIDLEFGAPEAPYAYSVSVDAGNPWFISREELRGPVRGVSEILAERDATGARLRRDDRLVPVLAQPQVPVVDNGADHITYPVLARPRAFLRGLFTLRPTPAVMRSGVSVAEWPDSYGRDLAARLHRFVAEHPDRYQDYLAFMQEFVGWAWFGAPARNGTTRVQFREGSHPTPLAFEAASDGTAVEAWLATLALDPPDGVTVFLLDEPAGAFFRRSLQRPAQLIRTLAVRRQVVVATHAGSLVSELADPTRTWVCSRKPAEGATLRPLSSVTDDDELIELGLGETSMLHASEVGEDG